VLSFHHVRYGRYGLDPLLAQKIMDPSFTRAYWEQAKDTLALAQALQPGADVIIGETSAAWHSGQCGVTDRFVGSFWYANVLGRMARGGAMAIARHSFNGGCYAMVNRTDMQPNPDFWIGLLFSLLMGDGVLDIRTMPAMPLALSGPRHADLLVYAHTSRRFGAGPAKGATLLLVNLSPTVAFSVNLSDAPGLMAPRYEYHVSADALDSDVVRLNRRELRYGGGAELPTLLPGVLYNDTAEAIVVQPQTIVFVELPKASVY
jgi:heparanase 1